MRGSATAARATPHDKIRAQFEFYFSDANLTRDTFLRCHMDVNGYVPLVVPAGFPKARALSPDVADVVTALRASSALQLENDGGPPHLTLVRRAHNWEPWPILGSVASSGP